MGSQEQGVNMTSLIRTRQRQTVCGLILVLSVTGGQAQFQQGQRVHSYNEAQALGGYEDLLTELHHFEKPALPHVAPVNNVYNQLGASAYERYAIEKQDDGEDNDDDTDDDDNDDDDNDDNDDDDEDKRIASNNYYLYDIIIPSVAIGMVGLVIGLIFGLRSDNARSDDSFLSFLPKPQVKNNIVIDDLFNLDNVLGRIKRSVSGDEDTDYVAYLLNSVEVITNLNGGIRSTSCELNSLARDSRFPTLSRIISPFLGKNAANYNCL